MLQSPLTVTVADANGARVLDVVDLEFSSVARGGFHAATFTFPAWVNSHLTGLSPLAKVKVHDARSARCVFEGYLDIPGRTVADNGQTWQVGAVGAASVLGDRSKPYIVIDRNMDAWRRYGDGTPSATTELGTHPTSPAYDAWVLQFPDGLHIGNGSKASIVYDKIRLAGQTVAAFDYTWSTGITDANYRHQANTFPSGQTAFDAASSTTATSPPVGNAYLADNQVVLRFHHTTGGAVTIATDTAWCAIHGDPYVRSKRKTQLGNVVSGAGNYPEDYTRADWVVIDGLWFFCDDIIDIVGASIDATWTYGIDQMAYPDGIRLSDVLNDLALFEPDIAWTVGPSNGGGLHSFRLYRYPTATTDVRYVTDTRDGWSAPGAEAQLANRLAIYWNDTLGVKQVTSFDLPVPELDQWGRVRNAESIELGEEIGTQAAADRIGAALVEQMLTVQYAGSLTVARPIRDRYTGRMVMPWEIEPGCLVAVTDLEQPPLRLTEVSYSDSGQAATLTLGDPVYTPEELVGKVTNQRARPRR